MLSISAAQGVIGGGGYEPPLPGSTRAVEPVHDDTGPNGTNEWYPAGPRVSIVMFKPLHEPCGRPKLGKRTWYQVVS